MLHCYVLMALLLLRGRLVAPGEPPHFLAGVQTTFRVPAGTKQFRLLCPVKNSDAVLVQWKKDDEQVNVELNQRYKLGRANRELKIRKPQAWDSGKYQCQAVNGFGHRELDFVVIIYERSKQKSAHMSSLTPRPPQWANDSDMRNGMSTRLRVSVGGSVTLQCPAVGNPLPRVTWLKDGLSVQREVHFEHSSAVMRLFDARVSDSGEYVCRVENRFGSIQATFRVRVGDFFNADHDARWAIDEQSPLIEQPFNTSIRLGHTAQFQCKVKSQHPPIIKWLKRVEDPSAVRRWDENATLIHANHMHLLLLEQAQESAQLVDGVYTNRLLIPSTRAHHAGIYICVVTNSHGDIVYRSAHLNVISGDESSQTVASVYVYGGVAVALLSVSLVLYALHLLCGERESNSEKHTQPQPHSTQQDNTSLLFNKCSSTSQQCHASQQCRFTTHPSVTCREQMPFIAT